MEGERDYLSLKHRRKKSSLSLSGCFNRTRTSFDWSASASASPSSSSSWLFKSRGVDSPYDVKPKTRQGRHRRHSSDFSYDPLSYALNFEEDVADSEELPARNFTSRFPISPPKRSIQSLNEKLDALALGRRVGPVSPIPRTERKAKSEAATPVVPLSPSSPQPPSEILVLN